MKGQKGGALSACLVTMCAFAAPAEARMTRDERAVADRVNGLRGSYGLKPLRGDRRLARAADAHSHDMLKQDFFAHSSSNGTAPANRIRRYRRSRVVGETLAYMPKGGRTSARAVVGMWINSPGHLATLTTPRFRRIGVSKRRGKLNGTRVTVWTVDLSSRR